MLEVFVIGLFSSLLLPLVLLLVGGLRIFLASVFLECTLLGYFQGSHSHAFASVDDHDLFKLSLAEQPLLPEDPVEADRMMLGQSRESRRVIRCRYLRCLYWPPFVLLLIDVNRNLQFDSDSLVECQVLILDDVPLN